MSKQIWNTIIERVSKQLDTVTYEEFFDFVAQIHRNDIIFVTGAGRSGLVGRFFAMRLMHLGKSAHIVGETTTPRIDKNNLLVCISGSGRTSSIVNAAKTASQSGAKIASITSNKNSLLSDLSNSLVFFKNNKNVPSCEKLKEHNSDANELNIMPMGTPFELSCLIFLESVIAEIIMECCIQEIEMKHRHTNLE